MATKGGAERLLVYIISYHAQRNVANYVTSLEEIMVEYESSETEVQKKLRIFFKISSILTGNS